MSFDSYLKKVGKNIQHARRRLKLTQEDMADKGFNYRYYQKMEGGRVNLTLKTLWILSRALKCSVYQITHEK